MARLTIESQAAPAAQGPLENRLQEIVGICGLALRRTRRSEPRCPDRGHGRAGCGGGWSGPRWWVAARLRSASGRASDRAAPLHRLELVAAQPARRRRSPRRSRRLDGSDVRPQRRDGVPCRPALVRGDAPLCHRSGGVGLTHRSAETTASTGGAGAPSPVVGNRQCPIHRHDRRTRDPVIRRVASGLESTPRPTVRSTSSCPSTSQRTSSSPERRAPARRRRWRDWPTERSRTATASSSWTAKGGGLGVGCPPPRRSIRRPVQRR